MVKMVNVTFFTTIRNKNYFFKRRDSLSISKLPTKWERQAFISGVTGPDRRQNICSWTSDQWGKGTCKEVMSWAMYSEVLGGWGEGRGSASMGVQWQHRRGWRARKTDQCAGVSRVRDGELVMTLERCVLYPRVRRWRAKLALRSCQNMKWAALGSTKLSETPNMESQVPK